MPAPLFPLFADLQDRTVLVVGGGAVARRKVEALLECGASVRVGALALEPGLARLAAEGRLTAITGPFDPSWLDDAWSRLDDGNDKEQQDPANTAQQGRINGETIIFIWRAGYSHNRFIRDCRDSGYKAKTERVVLDAAQRR